MCGRFTLTLDAESLAAAFPGFAPPPQVLPRYNVAPTQPVLAVPNSGDHKIDYFLWGLIPSWSKDTTIGSRMINARAETLAEKPSFKNAFKRRRCLILADGFYEWRAEPGSKRKTPMYIRMKGGQPFAFAGLWEVWHPGDEAIKSCTIITTDPNELLSQIHNRMPVILPPSAWEDWLDPGEGAPEALAGHLRSYPADQMEAYAVFTLVNRPENDAPEC